MKILAIIPARKGSKRIINKNIKLLKSKPLISYTIEKALQSTLIDKVCISTDDEVVINLAQNYNIQTPIKRPNELSVDTTPDKPVIEHVINYLRKEENYIPDFILYLRPTSPLRSVQDIENVILKWRESKADSVRTVTKVEGVFHPYWMYKKNQQGMAQPVIEGVTIEKYYQSQLLPDVYRLNGTVDGIAYKTLEKYTSLYGDNMAMVEVPNDRAIDIDTQEDFDYAEFILSKRHEKH